MSERLTRATAVLAGAGLLVGCSSEQPSPPPQELVVAHKTKFGKSEVEGIVSNTLFTPLDVGSRVVGICVLYTRDEIAPEVNSGFIKVKLNNEIGAIRTFEKTASGETVNTFKGMSEGELVEIYSRCPDSPTEK